MSELKLAVCESCGQAFKPNPSSKGRFCSYTCSHVGARTFDHEEAIRLYLSGLGGTEIAQRLGVSWPSVYRILAARNIPLRTISESNRLQAQRSSPAERMARTAAAHQAKRGRPNPREALERGAQTRYERQVCIGPHELRLAEMLANQGITFTQQFPCGTYSLDFALNEHFVAVETTPGNHRGASDYAEQRLKYILGRWHVFEIKFRKERRELLPSVVDELVRFIDVTGGNPPPPGQYRVVWPDGSFPKPRRRRKPNAIERS